MNDAEALSAINDDFLAAMNSADVSAFVALGTDDCVVMPPNAPAVAGKEAMRQYFQASFGQFTVKETREIVDYKVAGEWAFVRGVWTNTLTAKTGGDPTADKGKDLWVLRRQSDGSWKIYCGIYNSDLPLPGTA
jgi:uncharacterized protein (TIGR02246 family)